MKKRLLYLTFFLSLLGLCTVTVEAKDVSANDVEGNSYVIGTHIFTGNTTLTTSHIMLAAKTIEGNSIEDMVIYYKTPRGSWINGATGESLTAPENFNINYTDLKLEEDNDTVSVPKEPIISLHGGPSSINKETDVLTYSIGIYIDDIDDKNNKVDGVEFKTYCNGFCSPNVDELELDLKINEAFGIIKVTDAYTGEDLEIGKKYHSRSVIVNTTMTENLYIDARTYVEDDNGKRIYSEPVLIKLDVDVHLPYVEIVNNYSNPEYIDHGDYNIYTLGIKVPEGGAYQSQYYNDKFAYKVFCDDNVSYDFNVRYGLYDTFTVAVPKGTVTTCHAQLGYYDATGTFKIYTTGNKDIKYFTIDTRTLTAPVLDGNQEGMSPEELIRNGEYIRINSEFYKEQEEDTLDYQIEGTEIYRVYWKSGNPMYELVEERLGFKHLATPTGSAYYTARVYATNEEGKKVYSDFSEIVTVIRTPEIEVSEIIDGKVNVSIVNADDYSKPFNFNVYTWSGGEVLIDSFSLDDGQISIDATENMRIYVRAYDKDYESSGREPVYVYSAHSNYVDIRVE